MDWMEKEGEIYALLKSHCVLNIAPFGKGTMSVITRPYAYAERREVGLLVKRYGDPQALPDVLSSCRSAVDIISLLTGVCECHS